jgi:hypothetical protein
VKLSNLLVDGMWLPWAMVGLLSTALVYAGVLQQQLADLQQARVQFSAEHGSIMMQLADMRAFEAAETERQKAQDARLDKMESKVK